MMRFIFSVLLLCAIFSSTAQAFDDRLEGWIRSDVRYVFDTPSSFDDIDRLVEFRLGLVGNVFKKDGYSLDYEIKGDNRFSGGPREQAGFIDDYEAEIFRGWLRLDKGRFSVRGGRQAILFGAGSLFRPLGFFDTRFIAGVVPLTRGVDGVRSSYYFDETSTLEGWVIPAKKDARALVGLRGERLIGGIESGFVMQYNPASGLDTLLDFDSELYQLGYHFKGEKEVGFWSEGRIDIAAEGDSPVLLESVFGLDYTFNIGQGLHVLGEYFFSTRDREFPRIDPTGDTTVHQFGFLLDQPVGINIVWKVFGFYDVRDGSFQIVPQIEYNLNPQTYLYLTGNWGGDVDGKDPFGRLSRRGSRFTGTESTIGLSLIFYI